jgi:hypothetical protein
VERKDQKQTQKDYLGEMTMEKKRKEKKIEWNEMKNNF